MVTGKLPKVGRHAALLRTHTGGYVIIVILLLVSVILTIGLSLAAHTTQQIFLSGQQSDTTRVFNAAESGAQEVLGGIKAGTISLPDANPLIAIPPRDDGVNQANVTVVVSTEAMQTVTIPEGDTLTLDYDSDSLPSIRWNNKDTGVADCTEPALILTLYYSYTGSTEVKSANVGYNPVTSVNSACNNRGTGFISASYLPGLPKVQSIGANGEINLDIFGVTLPPGVTKVTGLLRIKPIYANGVLTVGNGKLYKVTSTATDTKNTTDTAVRTIQVITRPPGPPSAFDFAVISGSDLSTGT